MARAPQQRENQPDQVVYRRDTDGDGEYDQTDIWEKNEGGYTTKESHTYIRDGHRYSHGGKQLGKA